MYNKLHIQIQQTRKNNRNNYNSLLNANINYCVCQMAKRSFIYLFIYYMVSDKKKDGYSRRVNKNTTINQTNWPGY